MATILATTLAAPIMPEFETTPFFLPDVTTTVAVEMKLSHAAIVALGQMVEPMVVPEPVKMGFVSPGRMWFTSG